MDNSLVALVMKLADQTVSPAVLVVLVLIYTKLSSAISSVQRLEKLLERTIETVNYHSSAIAKLEGWLERHENHREA